MAKFEPTRPFLMGVGAVAGREAIWLWELCGEGCIMEIWKRLRL